MSFIFTKESYSASCFAGDRPQTIKEIDVKLNILRMRKEDNQNMALEFKEILTGLSDQDKLATRLSWGVGLVMSGWGFMLMRTVYGASLAIANFTVNMQVGGVVGSSAMYLFNKIYQGKILPLIDNTESQFKRHAEQMREQTLFREGNLDCKKVKGEDFLKSADALVKAIYRQADLHLDLLDRLTLARDQRNAIKALYAIHISKVNVLKQMIKELELQKDFIQFYQLQ